MARNLDKMENLAARTYAKTDKRKVGDAIDDPISDMLAKAQKPSDMAELATKHGVPDSVIEEKAVKAPNLGQFRMVLGNLVRGAIARKDRYETETGSKVHYADVGTKKLFAAKMAEWRKSQKPVKDGAKPNAGKKAKAATEKTPTKSKRADAPVKTSTKRVKGLDGVERDVTHEVVDDAPKGAPSKTDAAKRGKGKKDGAKRRGGKRGGTAAAADADAGVDGSSGQASEQEQLANDVASANA